MPTPVAVAEAGEKPAVSGLTMRVAKAMEEILLRRVAENAIPLPPLPSTIAKCLKVVGLPEFEFRQLLPELELDPMLAARLLKAARSMAAGYSVSMNTLHDALTRLGVKKVKALLIEAAAERLFVTKNAELNRITTQTWQHSVAVAIAARDLGALMGRSDAEEAHLAGLLHDIGKPIVASMMLEAERQIVEMRGRNWVGTEEWQWVVSRVHRPVGIALAEKWGLSPIIVRCIRDSGEFDSGDRSSLANVVCFANALCKQAGISAGGFDAEDIKAIVMIGRSLLSVEQSVVDNLTASLKSRVESQVS